MKKNSFTLIELLAVIIVLGVILTIAIPKVMGAIDSSKKQSLIISAESLIKELNKTYINDSEIAFTGKNYFITNNSFTGDKLNVTGELPDSGNLYINSDGKVALTITKGDYCVVKDFNDDKLLASSNFATCILNIPEPVPESCFTYTSTATEVTITDYNNTCSKNVIIPDTIGGLPVRIIGNSAFGINSLLSISIPGSVTTIGSTAFFINQLKNISIPKSVTSIGYAAFNRNQLPDDQAFIYARNPDGSENPASLISYGGIKKDNVVIPNTITNIGIYAFYQNQLTSITIPNSVTTIGAYSFHANFLTSVTIPNSVKTIAGMAFLNNLLTNISIPNGVTDIGFAAFNWNQLPDDQAFIYKRNPDGTPNLSILVSYGGAKKVNVIIPNNVTSIDGSAFTSNGLISITIPSSVTIIRSSAFANNYITSVTIPANVTIATNSISSTFYTSYVTVNGSTGGTYTAPSQSGTWTKQ